MTVTVESKNGLVDDLDLPNKWWFTVLKSGVLKDVLGDVPLTNDPLDVSEDDAKRCAESMVSFSPPEGWGYTMNDPKGERLKKDFIEFFQGCGGFTTR